MTRAVGELRSLAAAIGRHLPARRALPGVLAAGVLVVSAYGCDGRDGVDPCEQREEYAQRAADAQGRFEYLKRRCEAGDCSPEEGALIRVLRRETAVFRKLAAKCDDLCRR